MCSNTQHDTEDCEYHQLEDDQHITNNTHDTRTVNICLKTTNTSCHSEQLAAPRGVENFLRGGRTCSRAHQLQVVSCATSYNSKKRKLLERQTHMHISCHLSPVHLVDPFRHFSGKFSPVLVLFLQLERCVSSLISVKYAQ